MYAIGSQYYGCGKAYREQAAVLMAHDIGDGYRDTFEESRRQDESQLVEQLSLDALDWHIGDEGEEEDEERRKSHKERESQCFGSLPKVAVREVFEDLHHRYTGASRKHDFVGERHYAKAPYA